MPVLRRARALRWCVAHCFTSFSRQRGSAMVRDECVELVAGSCDDRFVARVREGPSRFVVRVAAVRRELQIACSCPVFALGRDACRHVWAALVAMDRAGAMPRRVRQCTLVGVRGNLA